MELVLNELSYSNAVSPSEAKVWYDVFFKTCLQIEKDIKQKVNIIFSDNPKDKILHQDFPFAKWIGIQEKDNRSLILSMLTSLPIIQNYPSYKIDNMEGKGIGYAYERDLAVASFTSMEIWSTALLDVIREHINDELDVVVTESVQVKNISNEATAKSHNVFLTNRAIQSQRELTTLISSVDDFWIERQNIFPNLFFFSETESFIKQLSLSGDLFNNLMNRCLQYDIYFGKWETGDFDYKTLGGNPRPESKTRQNTYSNELTILSSNNESYLFTWHCDIGIHGYRMHFYPDPISRKCLIGYIGRKIGT